MPEITTEHPLMQAAGTADGLADGLSGLLFDVRRILSKLDGLAEEAPTVSALDEIAEELTNVENDVASLKSESYSLLSGIDDALGTAESEKRDRLVFIAEDFLRGIRSEDDLRRATADARDEL